MMAVDNLETIVSMSNPAIQAEGEKGAPIRINKIGSPVTKSSKDQSVTDSRAFTIQQATPDTTLTGSTTYVVTDPAIICTVPEGITMIVDHLMVAVEDDSSTKGYVRAGYASGDLYVSGGLASSTANCLNSSVGGKKSAVSDILNGDTAIVMKDTGDKRRIVYTKCWPFEDVNTSEPRIADYKPPAPLPLVGPATFFVYVHSDTHGGEFVYNMQYREYATSEII